MVSKFVRENMRAAGEETKNQGRHPTHSLLQRWVCNCKISFGGEEGEWRTEDHIPATLVYLFSIYNIFGTVIYLLVIFDDLPLLIMFLRVKNMLCSKR